MIRVGEVAKAELTGSSEGWEQRGVKGKPGCWPEDGYTEGLPMQCLDAQGRSQNKRGKENARVNSGAPNRGGEDSGKHRCDGREYIMQAF